MSLDDNIRRAARQLRISLKYSARNHAEKAKECDDLVGAIDHFLGEAPRRSKTDNVEYMSATDAVRGSLQGFGNRPFTATGVMTAMSEEGGAQISIRALRSILCRMLIRGELAEMVNGVGRRPSVYRVKRLLIARIK